MVYPLSFWSYYMHECILRVTPSKINDPLVGFSSTFKILEEKCALRLQKIYYTYFTLQNSEVMIKFDPWASSIVSGSLIKLIGCDLCRQTGTQNANQINSLFLTDYVNAYFRQWRTFGTQCERFVILCTPYRLPAVYIRPLKFRLDAIEVKLKKCFMVF